MFLHKQITGHRCCLVAENETGKVLQLNKAWGVMFYGFWLKQQDDIKD